MSLLQKKIGRMVVIGVLFLFFAGFMFTYSRVIEATGLWFGSVSTKHRLGREKERLYARQLRAEGLQVFGTAEEIAFFIEFSQIYHPLKKARAWDAPNFRKIGARQWLLTYRPGDEAITVSEFLGTMDRRISWNPNLTQLFLQRVGGTP